MNYDYDSLRNWADQFQYWREVWLGVVASAAGIIAWIKRTRDWVVQKFKQLCLWLRSKWPYETIRKRDEEIARLKGKAFSAEEILVLQSFWAYGTEFTADVEKVMEMLKCKSQEALYYLENLHDNNMVCKNAYADYGLTDKGRKYIMNNNLRVSLDQFKALLQARMKLAEGTSDDA